MNEKGEFRLFDVYLGTLRRKEDFFTYYLASCLEFLYYNRNEIFQEVVKKVILKKGDDSEFAGIEVCTQSDLLKEFPEFHELLYKPKNSQEVVEGENEFKIFREIPLPDGDKTYYLDVGFFIKAPTPMFVGIEGKVFDSSVTNGQLIKYSKIISALLSKNENTNSKLFLLNTIDEVSESKSKGRREVDEAKKHISCDLILWKDFKDHFDLVDDIYFKKSWEDAYKQIEQNVGQDENDLKKDRLEPEHMRLKSLKELFEKTAKSEISMSQFVGFKGDIGQVGLDYLLKRSVYKISDKGYNKNWIPMPLFLEKTFELMFKKLEQDQNDE